MHVNFNSFGLGLCGGNRMILELTDGLVERGYRVTITHLGTSDVYKWYGQPKAEIINLGYPSKVARAFGKYYLRKHHYIYDVAHYLQMHIPDCDVNVATWYVTAYSTVYSEKGRMFYLVQHYRPVLSSFESEGKEAMIEYALSFHLPMTKLCVSHWVTEKVNGVFIGNGVNLAKFKPLQLSKKYDVMVIPRNVKWKGNYAPVIEQLRSAGLNVLEVKNASEQEMVKAYNLSKIFLYLSEQEGFGYPPAESLACGTPVISTPCTEYLVDNQNAVILPQNWTLTEVTSKIKWLLQNSDFANFLTEQGLKTAQTLDFNKTIDRFENAISQSGSVNS